MLILWIIAFILSLFFLVKSSDYFILYSKRIGRAFGLSNFVTGITLLAVGTSLPELMSCIAAAINKHSEIIIANSSGSNIANVFLVLGISLLILKKYKFSKESIINHVIFFVFSALSLFAASLDSKISHIDSFFLFSIFLFYIFYIVKTHSTEVLAEEDFVDARRAGAKDFVFAIASIVVIYASADWLIKSVVNMSYLLNIGREVIAASAVALGTSLPELVVSIAAARKGNAKMAFGNVLGSNVFNASAVVAIPGFFSHVFVPGDVIIYLLPIMLFATALYAYAIFRNKHGKILGMAFVLLYVLFLLGFVVR